MFENLIDLFLWALFGLVVGLIARFLVPGRQRLGLFLTIFLGIAGSFAGGFLNSVIFASGPNFQSSKWIMSIIGAVIVLLIARAISNKKS